MPRSTVEAAFARLCRLVQATGLPEVEEGMLFDAPALRVQKKFLACIKDAETLVIHCPLEEKELLKQAAPHIYWDTDHYKGWPGILVRLSAISDEELAHRIKLVWRLRAGKRLVSRYDNSQ
jgi:hypothetical protein